MTFASNPSRKRGAGAGFANCLAARREFFVFVARPEHETACLEDRDRFIRSHPALLWAENSATPSGTSFSFTARLRPRRFSENNSAVLFPPQSCSTEPARLRCFQSGSPQAEPRTPGECRRPSAEKQTEDN